MCHALFHPFIHPLLFPKGHPELCVCGSHIPMVHSGAPRAVQVVRLPGAGGQSESGYSLLPEMTRTPTHDGLMNSEIDFKFVVYPTYSRTASALFVSGLIQHPPSTLLLPRPRPRLLPQGPPATEQYILSPLLLQPFSGPRSLLLSTRLVLRSLLYTEAAS